MLEQELADFTQLALAADERCERQWKRGGVVGRRPAPRASRRGTRGRRFELLTPLSVELQGAREQREGLALRRAAMPALECADAVRAHAGTLRERLLREPGSQPMAP